MKADKNPLYANQYGTLAYLSEICEETGTNNRPTEASTYVRQKLNGVSANGKWQLIYNTVREIQNGDELTYFAKKTVEYFQQSNLPQISIKNIAQLIAKKETIPAFELLFLLADHSTDKSNVDGPSYSLGAIAAQNALKKLSADGKWEGFAAEIIRIYQNIKKE